MAKNKKTNRQIIVQKTKHRKLKTKLHEPNFKHGFTNIKTISIYRILNISCISYHDFLYRGMLLTWKLLNKEFQMVKLKSSHRKFYRRHHELVDRYGITVSQMISDMFLAS